MIILCLELSDSSILQTNSLQQLLYLHILLVPFPEEGGLLIRGIISGCVEVEALGFIPELDVLVAGECGDEIGAGVVVALQGPEVETGDGAPHLWHLVVEVRIPMIVDVLLGSLGVLLLDEPLVPLLDILLVPHVTLHPLRGLGLSKGCWW